MNVELETIPFEKWREKIWPLWPQARFPEEISPIDNTYGIMTYVGREIFEKVLLFPIEMKLDGKAIGWTSIYNISDEDVRIRGLYVLPEFRGRGLGYRLCDHAISLWPEPWRRCFGFWRTTAFPSLEKNWGLRRCPGYEPRTIRVPKNGGLAKVDDYQIVWGVKEFR